jgi:8-amino-7-oxononanoate synthase
LKYSDNFLLKKLNERKAANALRQLRPTSTLTDFTSNDYLGIVKNNLVKLPAHQYKTGSTGSRLLAGNYELVEETEKKIAAFHQSASALIFNSGYDANVGVLSCVPQKGDTILYDKLSHASLRDGIGLSFANSFSFAHNDLTDLEKHLKKAAGNIFIVTESVFSMDGDVCPLTALVALAEKYKAHVIIDEAHATGVIGEKGEGLVQQLQLQDKIFCRIHTFGKAVGCHGAVVLGSVDLRNYLINFARSFVYSTALPEHDVAVISTAYDLFPAMKNERKHLDSLIKIFNQTTIRYQKVSSATPIQAIIIPGNEAVKSTAKALQEKGFDVRPILYPTVPLNAERLRIVLHAFNTKEQLQQLLMLVS